MLQSFPNSANEVVTLFFSRRWPIAAADNCIAYNCIASYSITYCVQRNHEKIGILLFGNQALIMINSQTQLQARLGSGHIMS